MMFNDTKVRSLIIYFEENGIFTLIQCKDDIFINEQKMIILSLN